MKICPRCKSLFASENSFCLNDGTSLVEEPPPSAGQEQNSFTKSFLILIAGLVVGGGLVLALVIFVVLPNIGPNAAKPEATPPVSSGLHNKRNNTRKDSEFNGFVKAENANIRSSANSSNILDILPQDDRVNLLERDGPWYRVICEHGVSGWMHGDPLGWAPGAVPF